MHKSKNQSAQFRAAEVPPDAGTEKPKTRDASFTREGAVEVFTREMGEGKPAEKAVRLSVSSEEPYLKWCWDAEAKDYVRGYEVLGHQPGEIDFSRMKGGLVIQDGHYGKQIGIIDKPEVKDGKLCGEVRFGHSQDAQDCKADALDGIRKNMSVGYFVKEYKRDGMAADGYPIFRAVKWTPFEGSFVNVPADTSVGVGRSLKMEATEITAATAKKETSEMNEEQIKAAIAAAVKENTDASLKRVEALEAELKALKEKKPETPAPAPTRQFDEHDQRTILAKYDILRAIRSLAGIRNTDAGYERELSDEIAKKCGKQAQGFFVPDCVLARAFDVTTNAGNLVATDTLFAEMVPALVEKTVLGELGARVISGLVGDVEIPVADKASAYWVTSEGGNTTETTPQIGQKSLTPHTVGAFTDITRRLMLQSGISAQAFVAAALRSALSRKIEEAAFAGTGSSGQPTGLDHASNVHTIASATNPGLAKLLEFVTAIDEDCASGSAMKWAGKPSVWAALAGGLDIRELERDATGGAKEKYAAVAHPRALLDTDTNTCQGYGFCKANLAPAKWLYFGDWTRLILAFWSGVDLTVDTSSLSKSGGVRLVALQDMDICVSQPKAFSRGKILD